jgi:hypothetical protein
MWAIALPVASLPLIGTMLFYQRRAPSPVSVSEALGLKASDVWWKKVYRLFWIELDFSGAVLLVAGLSLLLVPLSLTGSNNSGAWVNGSFIANAGPRCCFYNSVFGLGHMVREETICAVSYGQEPHSGSCTSSRGVGFLSLFSVQCLLYELPSGSWELFTGALNKN